MASLMGNNARVWLYRICSFTLIFTLLSVDLFVLLERGFFVAPKAEAATGSFSVFRNQSDVSSIASGGGEVEVLWDTVVTENPDIDLTADETTIDLADAGKYLVLYNVWTNQVVDAGNARRSFETYLTLNEAELAYGRGDGYIRNNGADDRNAYAAGAAVIEASAGDDLKINIERDDASTGGQAAVRAGTNGVSVLQLSDNLDYLRLRKTTRSGDISANTSFTDVTYETIDELDTDSFAFTSNTGDITLKGPAGSYFMVTSNVRLNQDAGSGNRMNYLGRLTLDGDEIPGTRSSAYLRGNANGNQIVFGTVVYTGLVRKTSAADQTLNVEILRENISTPAATDIVDGETALSVVALPEEAHYISLTSDGVQSVPNTQAALAFDEQIEVESEAFSHTTGGSSSQVNIDLAGDYLFFSTVFAERSSGGGDRDAYRVEWRVDGSDTQAYGGHGSFLRGDQGTFDSFLAGSSGGVLLPGLTDTQFVELTMFDEIDNADAEINNDQVALQGVEIAGLVPVPAGGSVVSVLDDQTATVAGEATDVYTGQTISVVELDAARNLTNVVVSESGTIDAAADITNARLLYDIDTTAPYDCSLQSYDGSETEFGATTAFSGADGTLAFNDSVSISPTATFCGYVVYDLTDTATDGETINFSIADPSADVTVTGGADVSPSSQIGDDTFTTVVDAEITQANYHWRNDDGNEASATSATGGAENTPGLAFDTVTPQRLRIGVSGEGTGTEVNSYRLEFAQKAGTCSAATSWEAVDAVGGAWDMFDSINLVEGGNTTNIAISAGGVSDGTGAFVTPNGGVRDATSQTAPLSITADDFTELEYSVQATGAAIEGVAYCFRVTDAGTPLRTYSNYPEATLSADVTVSEFGTQVSTVDSDTLDVYIGGAFVIADNSGSRNVTELTITETGTIDAQAYLSNPRIAFDTDTSLPFNCADASYDGAEPTLSGSAFANDNGSSTFVGANLISLSQSLCAYVVVDVAPDAPNGATIDFEITTPNSDVVVSSGTVGPGSAIVLDGSTVVQAPSLTQANYHWRNDDGDEAGATSATGGVENTVFGPVFQNTAHRLRFAISNDGNASASGAELRLEYGTKVTSCANVGSWQRVDTGAAFDMDATSQLVHGDDVTNIAEAVGGVSNPNTSFVSPNSAQLETADQLIATSLGTSDYVEIEYALRVTDASTFGATYCFRVSDGGVDLSNYTNYAELTIQDRQDFFVQRGTETVSGTSLILTAGVDYTAPASNSAAYVRITNTSMTGAGSDTLGAQRNSDDVFAYIEGGDDLTSSFSIVRPATATNNTRVSWEIIEYIGVAGADNEFIVRDAGEVTYGGTDLFATGTAAVGVVDDGDVVVFITGQFNPDTGTTDYNAGLSVSHWDAVGDQPVFERGDADGRAARVSYAVVEFVGASWEVQRVSHTYTAAGVTETEPMTAVNSLARTFVHAQKLTGDELYNLDEGGHEVWLSSIGAVSFQLENGSTNPSQQTSVAWVIENTQLGDGAMQVYRSNGLIATGGVQPITTIVGIGATVNTTNATIWGSNRSSGGGNFHPRAILGARIINETQYELWKSDEGQNQNFRIEIVEWPVAETSIRQTDYRLYVDNDALTPTDPWPAGASDLGENTAMTDIDEPLGEGEQTRIRMGLFVNNASLVENSTSFKLQFARRVTTCSAIGSWNDVGDVGSGDVWRAADATPVGGTELAGGASLLLSVSDVAGTYEENSPSAPNPNAVDIGEYVEYDWLVENNGATQKSSYCFRMTENDGSVLDGYDVYPTVRTSGYTPVVANWRWYSDETNPTPTSPLEGENVAPSAVQNGEELKLRVSVTEVEGAPGDDIKFNLEYSEYPDFRDAVVLNATTSCDGNDLWCYADGAGDDNQTIQTTVLSGVDSCVAGVGPGCGTRNEAEAISGVYSQSAFTTSEHEFTLRHDGARVNTVYYFRLFDATNGVPLVASTSFPSLTTEGAVLTFTVSGVNNGEVTEGITTDATTTANGVDFGSLAIDTDTEAAQRLTVFANGTDGYQVFMDVSGDLINSYGDTIDSISSTNAVPATWTSQCTGATIGCFGYHAGDNTLYDGSVRFAVDNSYAGVESGLVEIMSSNIPVTFDVSDIVYRTRVGFLQPAGEYTTTVRYIIVPIF